MSSSKPFATVASEEMAEEKSSTLLESVKNLCDLSGTLSEFVSQWDALNRTLDSLLDDIDARASELDARCPKHSPSPSPKEADVVIEEEKAAEEQAPPHGGGDASRSEQPPPHGGGDDAPRSEQLLLHGGGDAPRSEQPQPHGGGNAPRSDQPPPHGGGDALSELHTVCKTMAGRSLRKFVAARLSEVGWLRREAPIALRCAPAPAKLVLDALGRFYRQGRRAYDRHDSPVVTVRRACILLLEFFVVAGCSAPEPSVREDAKQAAIAWRNRLLSEGGLQSAGAVDALGLVLFVAAFGVPDEFGCKDLYHLLRLSNLKKKAEVLRQSSILTQKIPEVIEDLLSKEMYVEAVDLICAFGLKEKNPPLPLLVSFLKNSYQRDGQCSVRALKQTSKKQLAALKSVVRCLEDNNLDSSELACFCIDGTISKLEKQIAKSEHKQKNNNLKRTAEEVGILKQPETQARRTGPASSEASHGISPHLSRQTQEQRITAYSDSRGLYNNFVPKNKLDVGYTGLHKGNSMGLPAGRIPAPAVGTSFAAVAAAADAAGQTVGNNAGSVANMSGGSYGWYGDEAFNQRSAGCGALGMPPSCGWMGPSLSTGQNFYQPHSSNLYQFADTVLEREAYYDNSNIGSAVPGATNPGYHSSYRC